MKIKDFEKKLKQIDKNFNITDRKDNGIFDVVAVQWHSFLVTGMPSKDIFLRKKLSYTDIHGNPHSAIGEILALCRGFIDNYKHDKKFKKLVDKQNAKEKKNKKTK